jgi:hypothetical protein
MNNKSRLGALETFRDRQKLNIFKLFAVQTASQFELVFVVC